MTKLISIITPVHNSGLFLRQCVNSVLAQTYEHWEHILVDDCSTDGSNEIIEEFASKDTRVVHLRLQVNSGAGIARNTAIEAAKGSFIAFLDSDDLWHPLKLQKQMHFMQENNYHFTFTDYEMVDEHDNKLAKIVKCKPHLTYKKALYKNPIGCLTVVYDVGFFGKQYMPTIRKRQDYALWLRLLKKTDGYGLAEALSTYRIRSNSVSSNKWRLLSYEWQIYRKVEQLSMAKSFFYTLSAVVLKMKSYF